MVAGRGHPHGEERQPNGDDVDDHVAGVSQQSQAAGDDAAHDFKRHVKDHQHQHDDQDPPSGGPEVVVVACLVRMLVRHGAPPPGESNRVLPDSADLGFGPRERAAGKFPLELAAARR